MAEHVDVVVLGMGPGGETAAGTLAAAGLSVVGIEGRLVGGECPYYACIPTKMMVRAADALAEARRVPELAGDSTVTPDYAPVFERIRDEATTNWDDQIAVDRFTEQGGRFVRGYGRITGPNTVAVDGQEFVAGRALIVATGTAPAVPPIEGLAETPYWTNREAIAVTEAPESLIVIGAGAVGLELAQAFARFGSRVDVVEAGDRLAPADEPEAGALLAEVFAAEGIGVHTNAKVQQVTHGPEGFVVDIGDSTLSAQHLLVATGRKTDLGALGVENLGLDPDAKAIDTDARLRVPAVGSFARRAMGPPDAKRGWSQRPSAQAPLPTDGRGADATIGAKVTELPKNNGVYAIGDVTGKGAFTHTAVYQARIVADTILGRPTHDAEYHAVPHVTFTDPEVGSVGLTEKQAREAGRNVRVGVAQLPSSARGWIHKAGNEGFIKLVVDADDDVLIGATSVGPGGGEVLSGLAVAVHLRAPVTRLRQMIYAYPTFHRAIEDALNAIE